MRSGLRLHPLLVLLLVSSTFGGAQDFSADIVDLRPGRNDATTAKVFVGGSKLRIEPQAKDDKEGQIMIWDTAGQKNYVLVPARHMYMELASNMMQRAFTFWRPADVQNACPDWEKLSDQRGPRQKIGSCRRVGDDTVNGRSAVKYEGTSTDGKKGDVWLDVKLRYLVKVLNPDGDGMEFRNIREGSPSASLFEIPPGYQKMDRGNMMHHSKAPQH